MIINCWQPSLWDSERSSGRFSLWVREVAGAIPGCPQLVINQIIGPNNSMFSSKLHFWEIILKTVWKTDYKNLEHNDYQLLQTVLWPWSSGMILALRAGGTCFNPRLSPPPDYSVNFWQQFHIRRKTAILVNFFKIKLRKTDYKKLKN